MNRITRNSCVIGLAVVALSLAFLQLGTSWLEPIVARAQDSQKSTFLTASQIFGLAQDQKARFCVGTLRSSGPAVDWYVRITDDRGNLLLQSPTTHSPGGEWRCVDVPRSSLNVSGEPGTGRVQVAASEFVKAPLGTKPTEINGSSELVNPDGGSVPVAGGLIFWAVTHDN